jgi:hypothetical protein
MCKFSHWGDFDYHSARIICSWVRVVLAGDLTDTDDFLTDVAMIKQT